MAVWFTSDLHLGHGFITKFRSISDYGDTFTHDFTIVDNINSCVKKKDKLFILGDAILSKSGIEHAANINCRNIELLLGNHDQFQLGLYLSLGWKIHGFKLYDKMWLSHCPIHPTEMGRVLMNVHGHVHGTGNTFGLISDPHYFNVNIELHNFMPIHLDRLKEYIDETILGT